MDLLFNVSRRMTHTSHTRERELIVAKLLHKLTYCISTQYVEVISNVPETYFRNL